jgi:hypothetical protein
MHELFELRAQIADVGIELGHENQVGELARIACDLEHSPQKVMGLSGPSLEYQDGDEPREGLYSAPVVFRCTPENPLCLWEIALLDRDLPHQTLSMWPTSIPFSHGVQCSDGFLRSTPIEEQASEHRPGIAVSGMVLQPPVQALFYLAPPLSTSRPLDRFPARFLSETPEDIPEAPRDRQDKGYTGPPCPLESL